MLATISGRPVVLGPIEFRLLELLARNAGIVLSRAKILERIWDHDVDGSNNNVDVYVSLLRSKLKGTRASGLIPTKRLALSRRFTKMKNE